MVVKGRKYRGLGLKGLLESIIRIGFLRSLHTTIRLLGYWVWDVRCRFVLWVFIYALFELMANDFLVQLVAHTRTVWVVLYIRGHVRILTGVSIWLLEGFYVFFGFCAC